MMWKLKGLNMARKKRKKELERIQADLNDFEKKVREKMSQINFDALQTDDGHCDTDHLDWSEDLMTRAHKIKEFFNSLD